MAKIPKISQKRGYTNPFVQVEEYLSEKYIFRYNVVSNEIEYHKIGDSKFNQLNESTIFRELMRQGFKVSQAILSALFRSDFVKPYNPFLEYFDTLEPWDQETDWIEKLANYVKADDQVWFNHHFKKHLVRAIACALIEKYYNKQALILIGEAQNTGKSTFLRRLCPDALANYFTEVMNPNEKDGLIALTENFLINLDELAVLAKTEINKLKSVLSTSKVKLRRPFEKGATSSPRRASFVGSTNRLEFLEDETGSVRWLCIKISSIDWKGYTETIDMDKVWSQAYSLFKSGFQYDLTADEIFEIESKNQEFSVSMPEVDIIQEFFYPGSIDDHDEFYTATDFLNQIALKNPNRAFNTSSERIGKALKKLGFKKDQKRRPGIPSPVRGYYTKHVVDES